jgi:ABC-type phosphate/phosphonate transport system permease subunit
MDVHSSGVILLVAIFFAIIYIKLFFEEKNWEKKFFFSKQNFATLVKFLFLKKFKEFLFSIFFNKKLSQHLYMTTYLFCSQGILFLGGEGRGEGPGVKL